MARPVSPADPLAPLAPDTLRAIAAGGVVRSYPKNTILIVGFQAQHTLGRRIVERRPRIKVLGVERDLRAQVAVMNAFSAHADKNDLLAYARACKEGNRGVYLVHGETEQQEPLAGNIRQLGMSCAIPEAGEEVVLQ